MQRIGLTVLVTVRLILLPFAAAAQPATKVWRIGNFTPLEFPPAPLIEALRQLGDVDGKTAKLEIRGPRTISVGFQSRVPI